MRKINITIEMEDEEIPNFENWFRQNVKVLDFTIIPDTSHLYKEDKVFKRLCDAVKNAKKERDIYYNNKRKEYIYYK